MLVPLWVVILASVQYDWRGAFDNPNGGNDKRTVKARHPIALDHTQASTVLTPVVVARGNHTAEAAAVTLLVVSALEL